MMRTWWILGAVNGVAAVALGAFAAHGLKNRLDERMLTVFETGVRYHMYHAFALLAVAWAASRGPRWAADAAGGCFQAGILLFSGSLYALAVSGVTKLGVITPFGGLAFLAGWSFLAVAGLRAKLNHM